MTTALIFVGLLSLLLLGVDIAFAMAGLGVALFVALAVVGHAAVADRRRRLRLFHLPP